MLDLDYLYRDIQAKKCYKIKDKKITCDIINHYEGFNASYLHESLSCVKSLFVLKNKSAYDINLTFHGRAFGDEAVVLYFELIIYSLILKGFKKIHLEILGLDVYNFNYRLYQFSKLCRYVSKTSKKVDCDKFIEDFEDNAVLDHEHGYRINLIDYPDFLFMIVRNNGDKTVVSHSATIIKQYLQLFKHFGSRFVKNFVMMMGEIIDNSICHTNSDCLISIKQYRVFDSKEKREKLMISVVSANFSDKYIYSSIKDGLLNNTLECGAKQIIKDSFNNNKMKFTDIYDVDFFCMVSAFQRCITTRSHATKNSGRGLTKFLEAIIKFSEFDECYAYSDNKLLRFKKEYLNVTEEGLIGFNKNNDFVNDIPNQDNFEILKYKNNGTLFNIKLIYDWSDLID